MTPQEKAKQQEYFNAARHHLEQLYRVGQAKGLGSFFPHRGADGMRSDAELAKWFPGGFVHQYGAPLTDEQVQKWIDMQGGNPFAPPKPAGEEPQGAVQGRRITRRELNEKSPVEIFQRTYDDFIKKMDEANAANEKYYAEKIKRGDDLAARRQERANNAGIAETGDVNDRLRAELGNIRAQLAANGLDGGTIEGAYGLRASTNAAREAQRIAENVDARKNQYDYEDTNNVINTIERRHDIGPDFGQITALADRLGQAQALENARMDRLDAEANRPQGPPQIPYYPAPTYGRGGPIYLNSPFSGTPSQIAGMMMGGGQQQGGGQFWDMYGDDGPAPQMPQASGNPSAGWDAQLDAEAQRRGYQLQYVPNQPPANHILTTPQRR